ncbi:MAG: YerC/YecD family TrpR-related protein [Clostridia bacterium]
MNNKYFDDHTDRLFKAILTLRSLEDCYKFFEDVCTVSEIKAITQRLEVAQMLREGKKYADIEVLTHASSATISRVNKCLQYGSDGYTLVLDRLTQLETSTFESSKDKGGK